MAITVNWGTKVISVEKVDMTLIQSTPIEVYSLDVDTFRLALKNLEDDVAGITFLDTHRHTTETVLSGVTYARFVEIINGYTIEFEDGQYVVNTLGANHNISDVKIPNQVSLVTNNSAGLITTSGTNLTYDAIADAVWDEQRSGHTQAGSFGADFTLFQGTVWYDPNSGNSGTNYPVGTELNPVNNISDAISIANNNGLKNITLLDDLTTTSGDNLNDLNIIGFIGGPASVQLGSGTSTNNTVFKNVKIQGAFSGTCEILNGVIDAITTFKGRIEDCLINSSIQLETGGETDILRCFSGVKGAGTPVIDMNGAGQKLAVRQYSGGIELRNKTGTGDTSIDLVSGNIILDSTITGGTVVCRGVGSLTDNSTGTATVIKKGLIDRSVLLGIGDVITANLITK